MEKIEKKRKRTEYLNYFEIGRIKLNNKNKWDYVLYYQVFNKSLKIYFETGRKIYSPGKPKETENQTKIKNKEYYGDMINQIADLTKRYKLKDLKVTTIEEPRTLLSKDIEKKLSPRNLERIIHSIKNKLNGNNYQ